MHLSELVLHEIGPFDHLVLPLPPGRREDRADVHLLVGPNGTGKTTILQAVAQLFTPVATGFAGRVRSSGAYVHASQGSGEPLVWGLRTERTIDIETGSSDVSGAGTTVHRLHQFLRSNPNHFGSAKGLFFHLHGLSWDELQARAPVFQDDHALVFAYGSQRRAPSALLSSLSPLTDNPLDEAALFDKATSEGAFLQWIANKLAQHALAAQRRDVVAEAALVATLGRVRRALAEVTGTSVDFQLRSDLSRVDVVLDGSVIPHGQLPAGLGGLLAWVGDLLMRLDRLAWVDDRPVDQRSFVLLLDEVEVHLHPAWQRRVLPMVERLFPKAQILAATHSPFVIQSASDAWVHRFELVQGRSRLVESSRGPTGSSTSAILDGLMGVNVEFSEDVQRRWTELRAVKEQVLAGVVERSAFDAAARALAQESAELYALVGVEASQLDRQLATKSARA